MRITNMHIDGFGSFDDCSIGPLHSGLNVVFGANEAGKSTLLDFVRGMLFGFADGRSPRAQHRPLRGGRHGGRMGIAEGSANTWTIERYAGKGPTITTPSGEQLAESFLRDLLGHTDKQVFESIFAFGLDELGQAERLHDESVRDLIFSAGVLGAGRSASAAIKQLEDERNEFTRNPRSTEQKGLLVRLSRRRDEIESELRSAKQSAKAFERLTKELATEQRLAKAALSELLQLQERKQELGDLEFASTSLTHKADLEQRLERCRDVTRQERNAFNERRAIEEFIVRFDAYSQNKGDLQVKIRQEEARHERIDELVADIGIDREFCRAASVTIATTSAVEDLVAHHQTNQAEIGLFTSRHEEIEHDYAVARRTLSDAAQGRDPGEMHRLNQQREDIRTLRSMASELREREHAYELRRQAMVPVAQVRVPQARLLGVLFAVITVLGALFDGLSFIASHGPVRLLTVSAGSLVLLAGVVGLILHVRAHQEPEVAENTLEPRAPEHLELASNVSELASDLELPEHPADGQIEAKDRSISRDIERAGEIAQLARDVREIQEDLDNSAQKLERARGIQRGLIERSCAIAREFGIQQQITPHALLECLGKINEVKKLLEADGRSAGPMASQVRHITEYESSVAELFARCGVEPPHVDTIEHRLKELAGQCGEVERVIAIREGLRVEIANEDNRLTALLHRDGDRLYQELATSSPAERAEELARISATEEHTKSAQLTHLQRGEELRSALVELQGSTSIGDLELELESVRATIASNLERWSVLGLSSLLLKKTLQRYETERQPAVIARAGELFCKVTDANYHSLIAREDGAGRRNLEVLRHDGSTVEAQYLSKGTAEQLYLCVRLAYAENFAERSVALPLVLDDVLVNFDMERTRQMASAIARVGEQHQVLLFTCHPHIVDLFEATTSDLSVVQLTSR